MNESVRQPLDQMKWGRASFYVAKAPKLFDLAQPYFLAEEGAKAEGPLTFLKAGA